METIRLTNARSFQLPMWIVFAVFAAAPVQGQTDQSSEQPTIVTSIFGSVGIPGGRVQVREDQFRGNSLRINGQLGVHDVESVQLNADFLRVAGGTLKFSVETFFLDGSATTDRNLFFNGAEFEGGTSVETDTNGLDYARFTGMYEHALTEFGQGGVLSGDVGLTFVSLNFKLHGTLTADSPGNETEEHFVAQELPVPLIGASVTYPLAESVTLVSQLDGGYLPWIDSFRKEGGTVSLTQGHLDYVLGIRYRLTSSTDLIGAYRLSYFTQHEESHEDNNKFSLTTNSLLAGVSFAF